MLLDSVVGNEGRRIGSLLESRQFSRWFWHAVLAVLLAVLAVLVVVLEVWVEALDSVL